MPPQQVGQKLFTLYVGDLDEQIDDNMLFVIFSKFGPISQLKIARDYETKRSKGFGFVSFGDANDGTSPYSS
jgi:RNA recognition motif-containing protein